MREPGPFDEVLENPVFWAALARQCATYGPQAPPAWARILAGLGAAVGDLLRLIEEEGQS